MSTDAVTNVNGGVAPTLDGLTSCGPAGAGAARPAGARARMKMNSLAALLGLDKWAPTLANFVAAASQVRGERLTCRRAWCVPIPHMRGQGQAVSDAFVRDIVGGEGDVAKRGPRAPRGGRPARTRRRDVDTTASILGKRNMR